MNLRDLEYFVAVAELGHFGKAAERCFCSQPTLSGQIKKLEDELGVPLFERFPGGVRLTGLGEQCLPAAREALSAAHRIEEFGKASRDPQSGELVVGAIPTIGPYLWPSALAALKESFPNLVPLLREEPTRQLVESIKSGRIDAGILALPLEIPGLDSAELWDEPFLLALPATHPLSSRPSVALPVLEEMELLLLDDGHCLREQALEVCRRSGARERDGFRATSLQSLRHMVRSGAGATLLPASAAQPESGLAIVPFEDPPFRKVGLCWRKGHPRAGFYPTLARKLTPARPFPA
ncbi:MAG: LysR family transcriptional regulator [Fibrobacteria bacterium]|nr:LysR family transcriptional regulator [Fibrobacteria bacterium]